MKKRKKSPKRKKINFFKKYKKLFIFIIFIFIVTPCVYFSYNYYKNIKNQTIQKQTCLNNNMIKKMNNMLEAERRKVDILKKELEKIKANNINKKQIVKTTKTGFSSESLDYHESLKFSTEKTKQNKQKIIVRSKKPLLAIIIDDVSFKQDVLRIKELPFKVTPSFFPPTKRHPNTPKLAKEFSFYMVHFPMEAYNYPHPEPKTLLVSSPISFIEKRVKNIKKWFPRDRFVNNHTGSKFTSNYGAMVRLYKVLIKNHLIFVDSRTSAKSVAGVVAKKFHQKLLSRDVFLDDIQNRNYIRNQLKLAVKIAKKRGYAIAIGHPHLITMKTLENSTDLLKGVKMVYIKDIYENSKLSSK